MLYLSIAAIRCSRHCRQAGEEAGCLCAELVRKRKQSALKQDLLLGFNPVELFVESIEQRYGDAATFCADFQGGSLIGIKWRSTVSVKHLHHQSCHGILCRTPFSQRLRCRAAVKLLGQQHHDALLQEHGRTHEVLHLMTHLNSGLACIWTLQPMPAMS